MATWIAHMRVAEHFMNAYPELNSEAFLVGNIGPDCGVPNEDWSSFTPDKNVTHWLLDGENIHSEDFKQKYIDNAILQPFYLGYYFHLITDIGWSGLYNRKKQEPLCAAGLAENKNFIWAIKKDWYGQDHVYLMEHPECVFYTVFAKIDSFENKYFDFYPPEAFTRQIKHITQFYLNAKEDAARDFIYLSKGEMNDFVSETIQTLEKIYKPKQ